MPYDVHQILRLVVWRCGHAEQRQRALTGDIYLLGVVARFDDNGVRFVIVWNAEDGMLYAFVDSVWPDEQRILGTAFECNVPRSLARLSVIRE